MFFFFLQIFFTLFYSSLLSFDYLVELGDQFLIEIKFVFHAAYVVLLADECGVFEEGQGEGVGGGTDRHQKVKVRCTFQIMRLYCRVGLVSSHLVTEYIV